MTDTKTDTKSLIPAGMPDAAEREIVVHVGAQTVRMPTAVMMGWTRELLQGITNWQATAGPQEQLMYTALKTAANFAMPIIRKALENPLLPPMPPRPRHSDPITYLIAYFQLASPYLLSQGEFTLDIDEDDRVTGYDWTYLDELEHEEFIDSQGSEALDG